ncbi:MAG: tyrosine-type recombinase/integrase, partial [Deltaproteobacteria bacterium]|nr:tyrosine-type recombinase/integrase [Deltaproteobacteria bacterium]
MRIGETKTVSGAPQQEIKHLSLHDLRHGALTELASVSPNLPGIAHIGGHKRVDTTTKYVHSNREQTRAVLNARPGIPVTIPVTDLELADLNDVADVLTIGNHNASEDGGIGRRAGFRLQRPIPIAALSLRDIPQGCRSTASSGSRRRRNSSRGSARVCGARAALGVARGEQTGARWTARARDEARGRARERCLGGRGTCRRRRKKLEMTRGGSTRPKSRIVAFRVDEDDFVRLDALARQTSSSRAELPPAAFWTMLRLRPGVVGRRDPIGPFGEARSTGECMNQDESSGAVRRVALLGNHLPRQCGIATFTTDLSDAISATFSGIECEVIAMNDAGKRHAYGDR